MKENKIDSRPFFYPISSLPMFKKSLKIIFHMIFTSGGGINLPSHHGLERSDVDRIANCIHEYFKNIKS